jgi:hypothetical protein
MAIKPVLILDHFGQENWQMLTYRDLMFLLYTFKSTLLILQVPKILWEYIIQYFPPNLIIDSLELYE